MPDSPQSSDKDFGQLVALNDKLDQQLSELESSGEFSPSSSHNSASWKRWMGYLAMLAASLVAPFFVLLRTSVFLYLDQQLNGWLALAAGVVATMLLLLGYALFASYKYNRKWGLHRYAVRGVLVLVMVYTLYGLLYYSSLDTKTDEIASYYRSLHPIMRVALTTITLADSQLLITDIQRQPEDYARMGLPEKQQSLHYVQSDGYVHAVDLRTRGRAEWKNWLRRLALRISGLRTLRHEGTADHLHVYLPLNE